ncbi:MAG: hypothetical protein HYZ75_10170 [Elusimicrobia bacterium]|nr:hypothetical protein [Elusimicrobiota bacterium]
MPSEALRLAWDFAFRPRRGVGRVLDAPRKAPRLAGLILLAYMAASAVFYRLKPEGFPMPMEGFVPLETPHSLFFWLKVQLWTPALAAVLVAATAWFSGLLKDGKLPLRLAAAVLSAAAPVILLVLHANGKVGTPLFAGLWVVLLAAMVPGWRALDARTWSALGAILLAANAPALALLPAFSAAVLLRSEPLYHVLEMTLLFWTLGVCAFGVGRAREMPTARAFAAVFLGFIAQIFFVFSMHNAGLLPKDVLKALMAV